MVVVFGGVGSLWGTLAGALSLGVATKFIEPFAGAIVGQILVLVAIILFIQRRPRGLFALKGRTAEGLKGRRGNASIAACSLALFELARRGRDALRGGVAVRRWPCR